MTEDTYSEEETVARREAALKRMLATPPKRQEGMRLKPSRQRAEKDGAACRTAAPAD